jgi:TusA-related sulfurtransferase
VVALVAAPFAAFAQNPTKAAENLEKENMRGNKAHSMVNCPSTVPGAKTSVKDTKKGVEIDVTAEGRNAVLQIQARARTQEPKRKVDTAVTHTGEGTGEGALGFCPVIHVGTQVSVKNLKDGVRITVSALDPKNVDQVQKVAKERAGAIEKGKATGPAGG